MKFNGLLLFPIALILIIAITSSPKKSTYEWQPSISHATLHDSLPFYFLQQVKPQEIQGYEVSKNPLESTFYYEYTANHTQLLKSLSNLPFAIDSVRADVQCRIVLDEQQLKHVSDLLEEQAIAKIFNRTSALNNYTVYECLKTQHHFVLLSKDSDEVIHIIQQV